MGATVVKQLPKNIDYKVVEKNVGTELTPLNVVLLQEIQRYNSLLDDIR